MNHREKTPKINPPENGKIELGTMKVNLVVAPVHVQPAATLDVQPTFLGGPIMREDFITTTGSAPLLHDS